MIPLLSAKFFPPVTPHNMVARLGIVATLEVELKQGFHCLNNLACALQELINIGEIS